MPQKYKPVIKPTLGLKLGQAAYSVPPRALVDGLNFRVSKGSLSTHGLGWEPYYPPGLLNNSFTKVLLHFDGTDASTRIIDSAVGASVYKVWAASGNAQIDTAQSVFGGSSLLCDGVGDFVSAPDHADFSLGSNSFRISMRFSNAAATGGNERMAGQSTGVAAASAWMINLEPTAPDDHIRFRLSNGAAFIDLHGTIQYTNAVNTGFHLVTITRMGDTIRLFEDGILTDSATFTGSVNDSAEALRVGHANDGGASWEGWIDEFEISVGGTYETADFTPTAFPYNKALEGSFGFGPAMQSDRFSIRGVDEITLFLTDRYIYRHDFDANQAFWINPSYNQGTVDVSNANPAVVTDASGAPTWQTAGIKAGDRIVFGTSTSMTPDDNWYTIASVDAQDQLTLTTAVAGAPLAGVSYRIVRVFTNSPEEVWSFSTFVAPDDGVGDDLWFATNGVDPVCSWDGNALSMISREALGFTARYLSTFKNMMIYANITIGGEFLPQDFINSDVGKPLDVVNGLAGQFRVHDGSDHIKNLEDLADNMSFYSERTITLMQFVGEPLVFVFREASTGVGPFASRHIADFGDYHEFVGADSLYKFDGVSVSETAEEVWREVLRLRDPTRNELGFSHFDEENGDLLWVVALTADAGAGDQTKNAEMAFVEHYLEEEPASTGRVTELPFSRRQMPFYGSGFGVVSDTLTWDEMVDPWEDLGFRWNESSLFAAFPLNLMCSGNGIVYKINTTSLADGLNMAWFFRFPRRPLGDTTRRGVLRRVYPYVEAGAGHIKVKTRYYDHPEGNEAREQIDMYDQTQPEEGHFVAPYRRGRFFDVEFGQEDGTHTTMGGYDVEMTVGEGQKR